MSNRKGYPCLAFSDQLEAKSRGKDFDPWVSDIKAKYLYVHFYVRLPP